MLEKIIINLDMDSYKLRSFIYKMALLLWPAERSGVEVSQAVVMAALASMALAAVRISQIGSQHCGQTVTPYKYLGITGI